LDWSAPPEVLGKIGTDIIDNKCSWVVNTALLLTSPDAPSGSNPYAPNLTAEDLKKLRADLEANYGRKDSTKEERVKEIFRELGIPKAYEAYEDRVVGVLKERIAAIDEGKWEFVVKGKEGEEKVVVRREVFNSFLGKIYKRSK